MEKELSNKEKFLKSIKWRRVSNWMKETQYMKDHPEELEKKIKHIIDEIHKLNNNSKK